MSYSIALFDADNTLLDFSRSERDALSECLIARGIEPTDQILSRYAEINDLHWKRLEQGLTTRAQLKTDRFSDLFGELGMDLDPTKMADDYIVALSAKSYCMEGAEELISRLAGRCRLFIITNGNASVQNARWNKTSMAPFFEGVFISEEMGVSKPDKLFFDRVSAAVPDFDPRHALVIGDSLSSDIQGGVNAGIDTCWFNRRGASVPDGLPITYTIHSLDEVEHILLS